MAEAVVDSNVVFAARNSRDQYHDRGSRIITAMDAGELPRGRVTNYMLPEILNPISKRGGHGHAVETLEFLTESRGFRIRQTSQEDFERGRVLFQRTEGVEITDAITVAHMRRTDTTHIYSFDDDFDRFDDLTRLTTDDDPFDR
ncbi:MAG: type II toxin-antitoxin system VapC family toxin [Haloarculaceae archaeon]